MNKLEINNNYQYFLKDHLGNVRVAFTDDGSGKAKELSEDSYYPFGMTMAGLSYVSASPTNKYLYNGKELQDDHNLNLYDYGARFYNAQILRFTSVDPHAENYLSWTPYNYVANNPMIFTDPTGMDWYEDKKGNTMWKKGSADVNGYKNMGANHTQILSNGTTISYEQNEAVEMTEEVLTEGDWKTQRAAKGEAADKHGNKVGSDGNCFVESGKMVKASGAESLPTSKDNISDTKEEIDYLDTQVDQGKSARVHVDRTGDKTGDHWVAISSRTTDLKTQTTKSYNFYDPGTIRKNAGTSKNNTLSLKSGTLRGTTQYSGKILYKVTDVRKNKQP